MKKILYLIMFLLSIVSANSEDKAQINHWKLINSSSDSNKFIPYIKFDINNTKISGFSGCNRFSGAYRVQNETIKFSPFASTRMMCPENQMNMEMDFFKKVASVKSFTITKSTLKFFNIEKKMVLEFSKVE